MFIQINGLAVEISQETIYAYKAHAEFTSAGQDWLMHNDPKGKDEGELLQEVYECLRNDYKCAVDRMLEAIHDSLILDMDFSSPVGDEYLDSLGQLMH